MTEHYNSEIKVLIGVINGVNRLFQTSAKYVAGTIRVIWNGQVYESSDNRKGWLEIDNETIEFVEAPIADDVLQAFYQNADSASTTFDGVVGSPFDPNGVLP